VVFFLIGMGSFQSTHTQVAPVYDDVAFVDSKGNLNTYDTPWYPTPQAPNHSYVWVKLKGKERKTKIVFDPQWSVYMLKREIVRQVIAPEIERRREGAKMHQRQRASSVSQNGVPSESRSEHSVSSRAHDYENSRSSLPEDTEDLKKEKASDKSHTAEEEQVEKDKQLGLPRAETLRLENRYFGDKLQNNVLKLSVALEAIGPQGTYAPDNDNALIIASHPDVDKEPDVPDRRTENPYANIEMTRVGAKAQSLREEESQPVVLHTGQPTTPTEEGELQKVPSEQTGEEVPEESDDAKLEAEKALLLKRKPEEMFIRDFSPPQNPTALCLWVLERLALWVGYSYVIWAGVKLDDVDCNWPMARWLFISGVVNLVLILLYFKTRLIAEYRKRGHPQDRVGLYVMWLICWLGLISVFNIAWQIVGSVYIAQSDTTQCDDELYTTTFWYVIAQWIVITLETCLAMVHYM